MWFPPDYYYGGLGVAPPRQDQGATPLAGSWGNTPGAPPIVVQGGVDRKALGSIRLCLAPSVEFNITKVTMIEELMQTLAKLYEKPSASNKVFLIKCLFNMKMVEG